MNKEHYQILAIVFFCVTVGLGAQLFSNINRQAELQLKYEECLEETAIDKIFDKIKREP